MNHERAFRFGRASHLVGVAGLPGGKRADGIGVIVLNAGMVHRIGPFRMNVEMTRRINALGYPTLRFDLSSIGDSSATGESLTRNQQTCADVADAMRLLSEQAGCQRFVLIGLCSGSQNAHTVACVDDKVAGAVFLDGYAYQTLGYKLRHYLPRLFDVRRWLRRFSRKKVTSLPFSDEPAFEVAPLPQDVVRKDFASMLERGMKLCLVYSGGISNVFNHQRQFRECFGPVMDHPDVSARFFKEADHTYILTGDRHRLLEHIEQWLNRNFSIAGGAAS